ncbi:MAG: glycosyltransferase family 39 protein [bacterium]|nr:glycosyltransferase family 39 protein [bacterium]
MSAFPAAFPGYTHTDSSAPQARLHPGTIPLLIIVILAAGLRLINLAAVGDANAYYTAAVVSMLQSPANFFFAAAEPGGAVTVDKPPVGLWLQALFGALFEVNGVTVTLPQVIAGILSVLVLYHLIQRRFGTGAGLVAALALAVSPISVAVDRNNTMDSTLILTLLLAAWGFIKAAESRRLGWLLLGALLVGVAFNIKMLQAFLPVPAFFAAYLLAGRGGWLRKVGYTAAAMLVMFGVSFSWAAVVELTPEDQRPYIGSSTDNSVFDLIFGYNGIARLSGVDRMGGGQNTPAFPGAGTGAPPQFNAPGAPPQGTPPQFNPPDGGGMGGETGNPGVMRLFQNALNNEIAWLLPFALIAAVAGGAAILRDVWKARRLTLNAAAGDFVLWSGWLITCTVFFSAARFFHAYYLATLAPAVAAMMGIGFGLLWRWSIANRRGRALSGVVVSAASLITLVVQAMIVTQHNVSSTWLIPAFGLWIGALIAVSRIRRTESRAFSAAFAVIAVALLIIPFAWSYQTMNDPAPNTVLPSAYEARPVGAGMPPNVGDFDDSSADSEALIEYLQANTQDNRYLLAVPSAGSGTRYVLATERPVLYLGGFSGGDPVLTVEAFAALVENGDLRFVLAEGGMMTQRAIMDWVITHCVIDTQVDTNTGDTLTNAPSGQAAPTMPADSVAAQMPPGFEAPAVQTPQVTFPTPFGGAGGMGQSGLYDCAAA